ncbi:MAG: PAC2 family protein [Nitrososphaerota archaeon]|nr:PAC2 family protein [Candidatus Bathyarchaeota archaeon]MDW8048136.1 PAC2 family protein [Nitrososphaerota archaeon]
MKRTVILEKEKVNLKNPVLIEGLPGLGLVGKIVVEYLARQLKAKKIAELYSPHFPYYAVVDGRGSIRLPRLTFYGLTNEIGDNDLILLTGDSQAQTVEGQYEVADEILNFAVNKQARIVITIGGYRKEDVETPQVFVSSTNLELLNRALDAGAKETSIGNPIVGTAGLLIGLGKFRGIEGLCLLAETSGYLPDPKAAKSILNVLKRLLNFSADLSGLDREIRKAIEIEEKMRRLDEQRRISTRVRQRLEEEKITYIS